MAQKLKDTQQIIKKELYALKRVMLNHYPITHNIINPIQSNLSRSSSFPSPFHSTPPIPLLFPRHLPVAAPTVPSTTAIAAVPISIQVRAAVPASVGVNAQPVEVGAVAEAVVGDAGVDAAGEEPLFALLALFALFGLVGLDALLALVRLVGLLGLGGGLGLWRS